MKAAVLEHINKDLVIRELNIPELEYGQVLVQVKASGICGKQIGEIAGNYGEDKFLPHLLGHEGGGIVDSIGEGVTTVKGGDHVVMHWRKGTGIESTFPKYNTSVNIFDGTTEEKRVGAGLITTFNEYAVVSENRVTKIEEDVPFEVAALMGCAITTGFGVVFNEIQLKPYNSITVIGCGGIGLNIIQAAKLVGAYPIVAIEKLKWKLDMAANFGATHLFTSLREEGNVETDFLVESHNGVFIADSHGRRESKGGETTPERDIPMYLERLWRSNRVKVSQLITHTFSLEEINVALDVVKSGSAGRCIIIM
uniref:Putative alcohol dehydrogenase n=1 Tax=viral metagenome TaxID=1070528 RepID=A0A6M3MEU2_9ZZZZ